MTAAEILGINIEELQRERFDTIDHIWLLAKHSERVRAYEKSMKEADERARIEQFTAQQMNTARQILRRNK